MTELQVVDLGNFPVDEATPVVAGPRGPAGADGTDGASAYEVAVANGFVGTEAEWLASLAAEGGGAVDSVNGQVGVVVLAAADVGADPAGTAAAASTADRARANHTGTQTSATISDFTEAVQDAVAALLASGSNVTLTYDDAANSLTVTAATGGDAEVMRDTIGAALVGVGNIAVTVNDAADTITISTTATVNSTDAALRDRSTHTGTQSADTLTDGTTNKAFLATERTKLAGVATGATANDTDANLKNRANHTGTQAASTITGLGTAATKNTGTASGDVPLLSTGGLLPIARIASGTPDGTKFVRDDGTLATPAGTGGGGSSDLAINAQTADYTLALTDSGKVVELDKTTTVNLTVPPNSAVAFPVGTVIYAFQAGAGNVNIVAGSGVTIRNLAPLRGQYAEASLRKRGTDEWVLEGDLASSAQQLLKDYAEVVRTAGDINLNSTSVTVVHTTLDLTIAAAAGDLVEYNIQGLLAAVSQSVVFDVYTMPSGSTVNPFGPGLSPAAATLQGVPGWEVTAAESHTARLSGSISRVLTATDVAAGQTTLRLMYTKGTTTVRSLFATANTPFKVWAKNYGPV